ncbi:MAG: tRNA lysidine(34) synthetase TilS [Anaerorhabdus sp.]|uniref:tRNA lysidine(34) synthetase TilS n=1 Tax=Anaerorhabdus sp. TaxID=1872524 RepID=UPI003A89F2E5
MQKKILNKKWIVAVSGGPDSMALLDMCRENHVDIIVAHVNYHKRKTANRDEKCVRDYCTKYKIELKVIHPKQKGKDNFQAWARDVRYAFFFKCCDEFVADGILVAHHQDDCIETYLLQKQRKSIPDTYGIAESLIMQGYKLVRPLLKMSKQECIDYCNNHHVQYQIDESNLTDTYSRNKIRHQVVEKLTKQERKEILQEVKNLNTQKHEQTKIINKFSKSSILDCTKVKELDEELRLLIIRQWLKNNKQEEHKKSRDFIRQLDKMICSTKNYEIPLRNTTLYKSYQICEIVGNEDKDYCFILQSMQCIKNSYFKISYKGDRKDAVSVTEEDFPITIRNVNPKDKIKLRLGSKNIHRWFIDRKIPLKDRKTWPVVLNSKNEVILVPGIGCNVEHYTIKPSFFVIKY